MTIPFIFAGYLATLWTFSPAVAQPAPPPHSPVGPPPSAAAAPPAPAAEPPAPAAAPPAPAAEPPAPAAAPPAPAAPAFVPPPTVVLVRGHPKPAQTLKVVERKPAAAEWIGLHMGTVLTPPRLPGSRSLGTPFTPGKRVSADRARACLDPGRVRYCGNVRGFDARLSWSKAEGYWRAPRWLAYFRSGYTAGRFEFDVAEASSLAYVSVPLFVGANVYVFDSFPIRPYGGLGAGVDIVTLQYKRDQGGDYNDVSARVGFELHGGIEVRISNFFGVSAEVQHLWSARRRVSNLPDFSNGGLTFIVGASVSIPTRNPTRREVRMLARPSASASRLRAASACESLAEVLVRSGRTVSVGERTAGHMLSSEPHDVGGGWSFSVPVWDYVTAVGTRIEGQGVPPTIPASPEHAESVTRARLGDPR